MLQTTVNCSTVLEQQPGMREKQYSGLDIERV